MLGSLREASLQLLSVTHEVTGRIGEVIGRIGEVIGRIGCSLTGHHRVNCNRMWTDSYTLEQQSLVGGKAVLAGEALLADSPCVITALFPFEY